MFVYGLAFVGIALCIFILWVIYTAHREEEREYQSYSDMWNRKRAKNDELYCKYLRRKHERECKRMSDVKKNE